MKKIILFLSLIFISLQAQNQKVYFAEIDGTIDLGLAPYVKRILEEAELQKASAIIFKINTFGGRVDAATQIKDAILNSNIKTFAFIDKRAISAGALISLSCANIIMVPGSSIGATTVVDGTGQKQSEKAQSYMRSEMRATAEKNNRPTNIAEAMVDERVIVEGLADSTQLVTLTAKEAAKWGIADTILNSTKELLVAYGLENADIIKSKSNWAEDFLRFLQNPIITSLLLMIGMVGFFAEIKTPGWGLPGTSAIIALGLFFGAHYILELASILEILLFVIGVILLLLEIFVIPGFGIAGILGIIAIISSLFMGLLPDFNFVSKELFEMALIQLSVAFVLTGIFIFILLKFLPKTNFWNKLILKQNIASHSGYTDTVKTEVEDVVGKEATALTDLRPSGTVSLEHKRLDVVTSGEYVIKGSKVRIIKSEGSKIVVEEI